MNIDIRLFNGENSTFDIAYQETFTVVDRFIVLESLRRFNGTRKEPQLERPTRRKVTHIVFDSEARPTTQVQQDLIREQATELVAPMLQEDDIVLTSDVDEIVRMESWEIARHNLESAPGTMLRAMLSQRELFANWEVPKFRPIGGTWATGATFKQYGMHLLRWQNPVPMLKLPNAGWHLSYCGGPLEFMEKQSSRGYSPEVAALAAKQWMQHLHRRKSLDGLPIHITQDVPESILENQELREMFLYNPVRILVEHDTDPLVVTPFCAGIAP